MLAKLLANLAKSNRQGIYPVVAGGAWQFDCIDARDVGRAMVFLAEQSSPESKPVAAECFLVRGYTLTWLELKELLDERLGSTRLINLPRALIMPMASLIEKLTPYSKVPAMTPFQMHVLAYDALFDDAKIRSLGFEPKYSVHDSLDDFFAP